MDSIFVFGSNLAGRHGKGAALYAREHRGAITGQGEGRMGTCYALPTKDENMNVRSLPEIEASIVRFLDQVSMEDYKETVVFMVTPIGTGLAGYSKRKIATLFKGKDIPPNVVFTKEWFE